MSNEIINAIVLSYPTQEALLTKMLILHVGENVFEQVPLADHRPDKVYVKYEQRKIAIGEHVLDAIYADELFSKYTPNEKLYTWFNDTDYLNGINAGTRLCQQSSNAQTRQCLYIRNKLVTEDDLIANTLVFAAPIMPLGSVSKSNPINNLLSYIENPKYTFEVKVEWMLRFHLTLEQMRELAVYYEENTRLLDMLAQFKTV